MVVTLSFIEENIKKASILAINHLKIDKINCFCSLNFTKKNTNV